MNILYVVGGDAWKKCFASILSLLDNNQQHDIKIFILSEETKPTGFFSNLDILEDIHKSFTIRYIHVPESTYNSLPDSNINDTPKGVNIKLLSGDLLPQNVLKVLYIDADTIINSDLRNLFQKDISDCVLAAAPDYWNMIGGLGVSYEKRYFNAGVMLINIDKWRSQNIKRKSLTFINDNNPRYNEQTALNAILHKQNNVDIISSIYNWMPHAKDSNLYVDYDKIKIVHYTGDMWSSPNQARVLAKKYYGQTTYTETDIDKHERIVVNFISSLLDGHPKLYSFASYIYQKINRLQQLRIFRHRF